MLKFATHYISAKPEALPAEEETTVRHAFGRYAKPVHRKAGEHIVFTHHEKGHRFFCGCRPDAAKAPLLFLVSGTHIRREVKNKGTPHHPDCEFARDPNERERIRSIRSYVNKNKDEHTLHLLRPFSSGKVLSIPQTGLIAICRDHPLTGLARTIHSLHYESGLDRYYSGTPLDGKMAAKEKQKQLLMDTAKSFLIGTKRSLADWTAPSLTEFYPVKNHLERFIAKKYRGWKRPHGLFIETFDRIEGNVLYPSSAKIEPLTVRNKLVIFGEGDTRNRAPYLVVGVLGQAEDGDQRVDLLEAYAHPCVAWDFRMLVDSNLERMTFRLLVACSNWLLKNCEIATNIHKPLFDVLPNKQDEQRGICLPDFILNSRGNGVVSPRVVVETMGYTNATYRLDKLHMRDLFERIGKGPKPTPIIEHDRELPNRSKADIDEQFCRDICRAISGKEPTTRIAPRFTE